MLDLKTTTVEDALKGQSTRTCEACGKLVQIRLDDKTPRGRWGDVWFCDQCVRSLAADELRRLSHEIPLRGVPMS